MICKQTVLAKFLNNPELIYLHTIGLKSRVFTNVPEDQGSIPSQVIPKTQKNGTWYGLT